MKLVEFTIQNYRRIEQSDTISVGDVTALVGGNETGKTSVLQALWKLNPAREGIKLDAQDEFPRARYTSEYLKGGTWPVVRALFDLAGSELAELIAIDPGFAHVRQAQVTSFHDDPLTKKELPREVTFLPEFKPEALSPNSIIEMLHMMADSLDSLDRGSIELPPLSADAQGSEGEPQHRAADDLRLDGFLESTSSDLSSTAAAISQEDEEVAVRARLQELGAGLAGSAKEGWKQTLLKEVLTEIDKLLAVPDLVDRRARASQLVLDSMPVFIYFDDYNMLESKILVPEAARLIKQGSQSPAVRSQWALFDLTGFDIDAIARLAFEVSEAEDIEKAKEKLFREIESRNIAATSAAANITQQFREWWKEQHKHRIYFTLDGDAFIIQVSDDKYPVPLKFESRSKGFRWFFTFYLVFTAETKERHKNAILLLDEPGLHLYAPAQEELVHFFDSLAENNQVIYTTHSGFMLDPMNLDRVRFLEEMDDGLVRISPDMSSVAGNTIMPVQAMVYYQTARLLFYSRRVLVVEGETDDYFWMFMSEYLKSRGEQGLPPLMVVAFAGGTESTKPLVAMMVSQQFEVTVLLDNDKAGRSAGKKLEKGGFLALENVQLNYYGEILGKEDPFDLESVLPPDVYLESIEKTHGVTIPRSVKVGKEETLSVAVKRLLADREIELDKGAAMKWLIAQWKAAESIPSEIVADAKRIIAWVNKASQSVTEARLGSLEAGEPLDNEHRSAATDEGGSES